MAEIKMKIEIPEGYDSFESIEEFSEAVGGDDVVVECLKRYFDYSSANKKYRVNKQVQEKALKSALAAKGVTMADLLASLKKES